MHLRHFRAVFERSGETLSQTLPIRKTQGGIWVPTPLRAIQQGYEAVARLGILGPGAPPGWLVDAGTGDGRLPALLSQLEPTRDVCGIERDPAICAIARDRLETLGRRSRRVRLDRLHVIEGDYCDPLTYATGGVDLRAVHAFFNYPDGNQTKLARFVGSQAPARAKLCVLTHDRTIEIDELPLEERVDIDVGDDPMWRLSIYGSSR